MAEEEVFSDDPPIMDDESFSDDPSPKEPSLMNRIGHMATSALPTVGMLGGGFVGSGVGPAGTIGGAGLGYAGGKELEDFVNNRLLGDEAQSVKPMDQVNRVGGNLMKGASYEMGGQAMGALAPMIGKSVDQGIEQVATNPYMGDKSIEPIKNIIKKGANLATGASAIHGLAHGQVMGPLVEGAISQGVGMAADSIAPAAAKGLEGISQALMKSPKFAELARINPEAFATLAQTMTDKLSSKNKSEDAMPFDKDHIIQKAQGTKYAPVLQNASNRGGHSLGAAHFILSSTDPEYRKAVMGDKNEENH